MTISWLHISDIHECDNDRYHRTAMYEAIIQEVKKRTIPPDVAFITGDLSFQGTDTEYESLIKRFINPLKEALPLNCPIFTVPGNHDVDRTAVVPPRLWMTDTDQQKLFQDVGSNGQRKRQQTLLPRFPLCQRSCRPDRIKTSGGAGRRTWLGMDRRLRTTRWRDCCRRRVAR